MKPRTQAKHHGRCGLCDEVIYEGDSIIDVDGEWCHLQCAVEEELDRAVGEDLPV